LKHDSLIAVQSTDAVSWPSPCTVPATSQSKHSTNSAWQKQTPNALRGKLVPCISAGAL